MYTLNPKHAAMKEGEILEASLETLPKSRTSYKSGVSNGGSIFKGYIGAMAVI